MSTTTTKTGWDILDDADGEVVGTTLATTAEDALRNFQHDALGGDGEIQHNDAGQPYVQEEGTFYVARPHAAGTRGDKRYTDEAIAGYSHDEILEHITARQEQLASAQMELEGDEAEIVGMTNDQLESDEGADAFIRARSHAVEIATQKRILAKLEIARKRTDEADAMLPAIDLIDDAIARRGMPCGVEEAGDLELATGMWSGALVTIENETEQPATNAAVADRVADAYAVIYGYDRVTRGFTLDISREDAQLLAGFLRSLADETRLDNPADWPHRVVDQIDEQAGR